MSYKHKKMAGLSQLDEKNSAYGQLNGLTELPNADEKENMGVFSDLNRFTDPDFDNEYFDKYSHQTYGYDNGISLFHDDTVNGDDTINTSSTKTKLPKVAEVIDKFMVMYPTILYIMNLYIMQPETRVKRKVDDDEAKLLISRNALTEDQKRSANRRYRNELSEMLKTMCPALESIESKGLYINCRSGVYDAYTLEKIKFDYREHHFFFHINAEIDIERTWSTPVFDGFIAHITGGDHDMDMLMMEFLAYMCLSKNPAKVFFVLGLEPHTGKSALIEFISKVIFGEENVSGAAIHKFADNFGLQSIANGSSLNVQGEFPDKPLDSVSVNRMKELTGHDMCNIAVKNEQDCYMRPRCKFVIAANNPIRLKKDDPAFFNRMVIIPMLYPVSDEDMDYELVDKLKAEADGIISKVVKYLPKLIQRKFKFTEPESAKRMKEEWRGTSGTSDHDSEHENREDMEELHRQLIANFVKECCRFENDGKVENLTLYEEFKKFVDSKGYEYKESQTKFSRMLGEMLEDKDIRKTKVNNKNGLAGIRLNICTADETLTLIEGGVEDAG